MNTSGSFDEHGLDDRIVRAVATELGFRAPSLVQARAIPLALAGSDVLVRARTGSGKTAAFSIPILQRVLGAKTAQAAGAAAGGTTRALVLVPSSDLAAQMSTHFERLCRFCADVVAVAVIGAGESVGVQRARLAERPDVVVGTPSRVAAHLAGGTLDAAAVEMLVVDEADLMLSFGYRDDVAAIVAALPEGYQAWLSSATLNDDVESLQRLVLHNPVSVRVREPKSAGQVVEQYVECRDDDKLLVLVHLLQMKHVRGRVLVFVNSVRRCYELKLFLDQFALGPAVLNSELPRNSRHDIVRAFCRGDFTLLIATDEALMSERERQRERDGLAADDEDDADAVDDDDDGGDAAAADGDDDDDGGDDADADADDADGDDADAAADDGDDAEAKDSDDKGKASAAADDGDDHDHDKQQQKRRSWRRGGRRRRRQQRGAADEAAGDFSAARGLDFRGTAWVVNVDAPRSVRAYTHRIGRTGRGGAQGRTLLLVGTKTPDEALLAKLQQRRVAAIAPLTMDWAQCERLRSRANDCSRRVTRAAVKRARLAEIRAELANSARLSEHLESHAADRAALAHAHDRDLAVGAGIRNQAGHMPAYMFPAGVEDERRRSEHRLRKWREMKTKTAVLVEEERAREIERAALHGGDADDGDADADGRPERKRHRATTDDDEHHQEQQQEHQEEHQQEQQQERQRGPVRGRRAQRSADPLRAFRP